MNYTEVLENIDDEISNGRQGRVGGGRALLRLAEKAMKMMNLKQVVHEVENSVMSKVSCTACTAGNYI